MTIVSVFIALLSFLIACLALTFTIGSFWWLNARQGRLTSFEPHSFATWASQSSPYETRVRFPLVLYNTGVTYHEPEALHRLQQSALRNYCSRLGDKGRPIALYRWHHLSGNQPTQAPSYSASCSRRSTREHPVSIHDSDGLLFTGLVTAYEVNNREVGSEPPFGD
jgi:hypothetical protein